MTSSSESLTYMKRARDMKKNLSRQSMETSIQNSAGEPQLEELVKKSNAQLLGGSRFLRGKLRYHSCELRRGSKDRNLGKIGGAEHHKEKSWGAYRKHKRGGNILPDSVPSFEEGGNGGKLIVESGGGMLLATSANGRRENPL